MSDKVTDSRVVQNDVFSTTDYDKFKFLEGNRHTELNVAHVNDLKKRIEERGNLTPQFPVIVNDKMEIVDGQHRFEALKQLGLPVFYEVKENLNIDDVITLNTSHKNWSWKDFVVSYAERGNHNYVNFQKLWEEFHLGFTILMSYIKNERTGGRLPEFYDGDLQLSDELYGRVRVRLQDYIDLTQAAGIYNHQFAMACMEMFKKPNYDQAIMEEKLAKYNRLLVGVYYAQDYYYRLEEIYHRP